jgi:hypothetical protein
MSEVKFEDEYCDLGFGLICPSCGGGCLHHEAVDIFERAEDAAFVLHTTASDTVTTKVEAADASENPSPRRNGLFITFSCEECSATPILDLRQHKGVTYLRWRECLTQ